MLANEPFYKDHWIKIDQDRLDRYDRMFQWNSASLALYEPADIRPGHIVVDFGCGPGHTAIEIAKWVGPGGHVHALDINSEFVTQARKNANAAGIGDRVTAHQCDDSILPLPDESLDRLTTRNTIIYVDDPERALREFRRVLRAGGRVHAIEGDWPIMVVEPVPSKNWAALVAGLPAIGFEQIGGRGQHVWNGMAQIDMAVAVVVDAVLDVRRRQKLCLADLASIGADEIAQRQIAALDDLKGGDKLALEQLGALE